jgi:hypothetical protein
MAEISMGGRFEQSETPRYYAAPFIKRFFTYQGRYPASELFLTESAFDCMASPFSKAWPFKNPATKTKLMRAAMANRQESPRCGIAVLR